MPTPIALSMSTAVRIAARVAVTAMVLAVSASTLLGQNPVQTVFEPCSARVYSARAVQVQAKPIPDSTISPRPVLSRGATTNTVAFTVDTLGVPEAKSLVRLQLADTLLWTRVEAAYRTWRFQPAIASGCKVRERVVAAVNW